MDSVDAFFNPSDRKMLSVSRELVDDAKVDARSEDRFLAGPHSLREKITATLERHPIGLNPEGLYLPDSEREELFKDTNEVQSALGGDVDPALIAFAHHNTRALATILLVFRQCENRKKALQIFQRTKFTDKTLYSGTILSLCSLEPCRGNNGQCAHHFPRDPWDLMALIDFKSKRWHFLVHTFDHNIFEYELDCHQLLPFTTRVSSGRLSDGNFSEVTCVKMLTRNQTKIKSSDDAIVVALKTLKQIDEPLYDIDREWRREAKAHRQLNNTRDHIIQAFAAYRQIAADRQNDAYHLVLEWADGGNLLNFWTVNQQPQVGSDVERSRKRVMEALKQLHGLADALEGMHSTPAESSPRRNSALPSPNLSPARSVAGDNASLRPLSPSAVEPGLPTLSLPATGNPQEGEGGVPTLSFSPPEFNSLSRVNTQFNSENWRHGDIKPENILRFSGGQEDAWIGTLKLADLGRARQHMLKTELRETREKEHWRTRWYEPPDLTGELYEQAQGKISRLFDIWSIGCVIFETALWLLYGYDSIMDFLNTTNEALDKQIATPYWTRVAPGRYVVSQTASDWMKHILARDPERGCAIGSLVRLVKDRLLKIALPPNSAEYTEGYRTNARDLKDKIEEIIKTAEMNERFLYSGADRSNVVPPHVAETSNQSSVEEDFPSKSGFLTPGHAATRALPNIPGRPTTIQKTRDYTHSTDDQWRIDHDDSKGYSNDGSESSSGTINLCDACKAIDIVSGQISFTADRLRSNAERDECDLCELAYPAIKGLEIALSGEITLIRSMDCFIHVDTEKKEKKVLRLSQADTKMNEALKDIPVGAPHLAPRTPSFSSRDSLNAVVELPKAWLRQCDDKHNDKCAPVNQGRQLPKRLINVMDPYKPRIVETDESKLDPQKAKYIALSHKWGKMPENAKTTVNNLEQRKTRKILEDDLPLSFKNAIAITRALGCDYLWIDTLCIIQGPDGDFIEQADTMQTTFSHAYCVIAACSAENATDGFLPKQDLRYVQLGKHFLSVPTNDFERDVLNSPLHSRGWVLQERALARRSVFFTNNQIYFECGDGVRCETQVKLKNAQASFLGDPNFPNYAISDDSTFGKQIRLVTTLFQQYSRLNFSHPEDRPIAIDGLIDRLTRAFRTQSLAGLFRTFWGRSLLWQKAEKQWPLRRIPTGTHTRRPPPSWSWMAFEGPISFLMPEGGTVDWNANDMILPFESDTQTSWLKTSCRNDSNAIRASAYELALQNSATGTNYLSYDGSQDTPSEKVKCVIIGSERSVKDTTKKKHYVILVTKSASTHGIMSYERVGVGHLLGKCIKFASSESISIE